MKEKVVAIVPVREFGKSKLRLRGYLSGVERTDLSKALFKHVLKALGESRVSGTLVVASDQAEISNLADKPKNTFVINEREHHGGVNRAITDGISFCLTEMSNITSTMIVPSDLPLLSSEAINYAISKLRVYDLIVGPSSKLDGTSLLLFNIKKGKIPFHYDNNSYRNHVKEAKHFKIRYTIIRPKEFSWDVDTKEDIKKLMSKLKTRSFRELLLEIEA
jgi:2-phospho-L-lactate guanylyltransferase